jgi:hypothetical protein
MFEVRKRKYWVPTVIACLVVLLLVSYMMAGEMTPERDTLHYIYSSIVQGFAAFVGILFVALMFMQQRGKELIGNALDEAMELSSRLVGRIEGYWSKSTIQTGVVYDTVTKLKAFHDKRIVSPVGALIEHVDDLREDGSHVYSTKDANDLITGHLETITGYRRAGTLIGRYIYEYKALRKFTTDILTVAFTMVALILLALGGLLSMDELSDVPRLRSTVAIFAVWISALMFAVSFVMLRNAFVANVEENPDQWFKETRLPDAESQRSSLLRLGMRLMTSEAGSDKH